MLKDLRLAEMIVGRSRATISLAQQEPPAVATLTLRALSDIKSEDQVVLDLLRDLVIHKGNSTVVVDLATASDKNLTEQSVLESVMRLTRLVVRAEVMVFLGGRIRGREAATSVVAAFDSLSSPMQVQVSNSLRSEWLGDGTLIELVPQTPADLVADPDADTAAAWWAKLPSDSEARARSYVRSILEAAPNASNEAADKVRSTAETVWLKRAAFAAGLISGVPR